LRNSESDDAETDVQKAAEVEQNISDTPCFKTLQYPFLLTNTNEVNPDTTITDDSVDDLSEQAE